MTYRMGRTFPSSAVIIPGVTGAYSAYSAMGSAFEIPYAVGNQGSLISQVIAHDRATGMGGFRVHFYNQVPPVISDKSAFIIPSGQENTYLGYVDVSSGYFVTAGISGGNTSVMARVTDQHLALYGTGGSGRSVWAQCQSLTAQTFGGLNSAQSIRLVTLQD